MGAFRTSPAQSLYIEAHEPLLTTRRLKLSLNYVLKLKSLPENLAYSCIFEPENTKLFEESESKVPLLDIRILPHLEKSKLNLNLVDDAPSLDIVPWKLSVPAVRFALSQNILYQKKKKITEGSETVEGVAASTVSTKN